MQKLIFLFFTIPYMFTCSSFAQDSLWSLRECIEYAKNKNIEIQKANLSNKRSELYYTQSKASRLPSASASINQNFGWGKTLDETTGEYSNFSSTNSTNYSVSAGISLFNGFKTSTQIKQYQLDLESSRYYLESIKESIEINILSAFLQVLYAEESVNNAWNQIETTTQQLNLATEHLELGLISKSDYLQIKSELASENLTLTNAQSTLTLAKLSLMQLMEYPVSDTFNIELPILDDMLNHQLAPDAAKIYAHALDIKPQIKQAELDKTSAGLDEKIAKSGYWPSLSLSAGIGTSYSSSINNIDYSSQLNNRLSPSAGLSLSIPIFQKKQVSTEVKMARIGFSDAELDEINTKNELRKDIEQAVTNVIIAQQQYVAGQDELKVSDESMKIASEKFNLGLLNSVDFLFEKTNYILTESQVLQAKYNLIFSYKVLDFYQGISLTL